MQDCICDGESKSSHKHHHHDTKHKHKNKIGDDNFRFQSLGNKGLVNLHDDDSIVESLYSGSSYTKFMKENSNEIKIQRLRE